MFVPFVCAALAAASLQGDPAFTEGQQLYQALSFEEAVPKFAEVAARPDLAPGDRAEAYVWLGLAHAGLAHMREAHDAFKKALQADPAVKLPGTISPRVAEEFHSAQAEVQKESVAKKQPAPPGDTGGGDGAPAVSGLFVTGAVVGGVGALLVAGGLVSAGLAAGDYARASDKNAFQSDAKDALDATNTELAVALALVPVGAVVGAIGGVLIAVGGE